VRKNANSRPCVNKEALFRFTVLEEDEAAEGVDLLAAAD